MKCPFCGGEMQEGSLSGDGRSRVRWEADNEEKAGLLEKALGKGAVSAEYSLSKFKMRGSYCPACKKMILDADIEK